MQKAVFKQQFEAFKISNSEGLEKGYDRFQQLLSQLEAHGAEVSTEDANHKFLRSLPSAWSNLAMTMRTNPEIDNLSIDDLYNNLRVFEQEIQGAPKTSSSAQNVAFVSTSKTGKGRRRSDGLLTLDDGIVNWGEHTEAEETNHALMAISSSNEVSLCSKTCIDSYNKLKTLCDEQMNQLGDQEAQILAYSQAVKKLEAQLVTSQKQQLSLNEKLAFQANEIHEKDEKLKRYRRIGMKAVKEKEQLQKIVDSWKDSSKNLWRLINSGMSSNDKLGLGFEIQSNDEVLSYEEEMNFSVFKCSKEDSIGKPLYSRFTTTNDFKGVPHPLSGDYTPKPQEEIDDSLYVYGKKGPQKPEISVSDDNSSEHSTCQSNDSEGSCGNTSEHSFETESESLSEPNEMSKSSYNLNAGRPKFNSVRPNINTGRTNINSGRPKVNAVSPKVNTVRSKQPVVCWGSAVKTSASYNWRTSRPNFNYSSGPTHIRTVNANGPQGRPKPAKAGAHDSFDMKTPSPAKGFACLIAKAKSIMRSKLWHRRRELEEIALKHLGTVPENNTTSTPSVNTGSQTVNTGRLDHDDSLMPELEIFHKPETGIFDEASYDVGWVQILGDNKSAIQTRKQSAEQIRSSLLFQSIQKAAKNKSQDQQPLFVCLLLSSGGNLKKMLKLYKMLVGGYKTYKKNLLFTVSSYNNCNHTPWDQLPLTKDEEDFDVDVHLYRSMIGSLMYLTASRPDIMYAVCVCSRFQVTPKTSHLNAVKRIFKYLKGKPNLGLWYPRESPFDLEAFSDSDYGGSNLDRKSTTGGCQFLGQRLISWQCKKQTIVATSTTEAEYVAAANCCGQVLWVQNQLLDYGFNFMNTKIHIDNESTICIVKNPVYHSKTKHIEIRHHFIRDCYEKKLISVEKIHTDLNVADLLTKPFDGPRFNYLVVSIEINATIDTIRYTISEASIRDSLQLEDATGITMLPNDELFEGMGQIGYPTDGTFTFWKSFFTPQWRYLVHHLLHCISSKSGGWDQFGSNIATALICLSTGRVYNFSKLIFDGMVANLKSKTKFLMYPRFLQMILNIQTENKHLYLAVSLTKKIFGNMKRGFRGAPRPLLPSMLLVATNPNAGQEHAAVAQSQPSSSTPQGRRLSEKIDYEKRCLKLGFHEEADIGVNKLITAEGVSTGSTKLSTGSEQVSTVGDKKSTSSDDKGQREGKAPMIIEEAPKKSKEQVLQEEASLAEAIRLDTLQKEEVAKQVHLDSLLAQRIAEEEELNEQQKKRKAQVHMLGSEVQGEDFAKKMVELVNQRKKYFAEERARAKRNKPMTQSQLKTYMMNYLKNQGTWKLSQLKNLSFEKVKNEFNKLVKQVESFAPINFEATKANLKRFGEELQTKTPKRLKDDEDVEKGC
ncbi:hypothetical protein Tco_1045626 [Tanacetum coccineum]|uniref:Uncharacterized protein n=1 Tax=Tanacetum coccineum TaxID=301880 RepID=A0ABQ5GTB4_9ASTR